MGKAKFIWGGIVLIALVFAGFLWHRSYSTKIKDAGQTAGKTEEANLAQTKAGEDTTAVGNTDEPDPFAGQDFNALCENGEWVKIAEQAGANVTTTSGKLRKVYPDDEASKAFAGYQFFLEGTEKTALFVNDSDAAKVDYFEDREVEVQGAGDAGKNQITVGQIRCAGSETDKNLIGERNKLMSFIQANINSIAPQKAKYQKWTADIVDFVDEHNIYVEYYDTVEDDENSDVSEDTSRRLLLETSTKAGGGYDAKILAYWEMGEDDYVLKTGTDKFENVEEVTSYQYDPESKTWERID